MYRLSQRFIDEVAEATDNENHTLAVHMLATLSGERYLEARMVQIAKNQQMFGYLDNLDRWARDDYLEWLLDFLAKRYSNIADLSAAFQKDQNV